TATAGARAVLVQKIKVQLRVRRWFDHRKGADREKRVPAGGPSPDRLCGNIAASTRSVLDNERLTEPLRKPLTREACEDVGHSAGGKANDDAHWSRRIGLRPCPSRHHPQRGSARGPMQKFPAMGKFHIRHGGSPPRRCAAVG